MNDIDHLVGKIAPDPGPGMTPGGRELLNEITALPATAPARRRFLRSAHGPGRLAGQRRPWRFAVPAVAGLATATVALGWVLPGNLGTAPASAALDIKQEGDSYVITVKDLFADPKMYERELNARGLKIALDVEPAPPSLEGQMMVMDPQANGLSNVELATREDLITTVDRPGPCDRMMGCPIGLKVPVSYKGEAEISLARKARPGEMYKWRASLSSSGELLHCVDFVNKTLDEVRPLLEKRGISLKPVTYGGNANTRIPEAGSWYVHDGVLESATSALILVSPDRKPAPPETAPDAPENRCGKGS
ncbi:hypothetical protein [Streptosporangium sp. NPDC000396]|uniref:hypothetical protein n=1 Tax=Streptosporangium sp. NPDC000396 TaxID=3366185 RepID=UPI00369ED782